MLLVCAVMVRGRGGGGGCYVDPDLRDEQREEGGGNAQRTISTGRVGKSQTTTQREKAGNVRLCLEHSGKAQGTTPGERQHRTLL